VGGGGDCHEPSFVCWCVARSVLGTSCLDVAVWTSLSNALEHVGSQESPLGAKTVRKLLQARLRRPPLGDAPTEMSLLSGL
jgi:hypothetical protein